MAVPEKEDNCQSISQINNVLEGEMVLREKIPSLDLVLMNPIGLGTMPEINNL